MLEQPATSVVTTPYGQMECVAEDGFHDHLREFGTHQRSDTALLQQVLRPGDAALDVGAFIGTMAVPLAQAVGPSGRVVAFEPVPLHAQLLRRNLARNGLEARCEVVEALVGKAAAGRFSPDRLAMSAATTWFEQSTRPDATPVATLDAWMAAADLGGRPLRLLKVDVEGWELDVLRGAEQLLRDHRPVLALEVASYQLSRTGDTLATVQAHLAARDYRLLINIAVRDSTSDVFRLAHLPDLSSLGSALRDVVAVPCEVDLGLPIGPAELVAPALERERRAALPRPSLPQLGLRKARGALRRARAAVRR